MTAPGDTSTVPRPSTRRGLIQASTRLGWGVADQGISSLSNFGLGLFVARSYGAQDFGAFTLAFVTYTVVLSAARGLATDPFLVRFSGAAGSRWRHATSSAAGTALAVGAAAGGACIAAGIFLPHPVGLLFITLGIGLPGLMLQDSWRFAFFATGRGRSAFLNDLFWAVLLILVLLVLHVRAAGSPARCLLAFGATAAVAAALGGLQARVVPRPQHAREWLRTHSGLSARYLVENVSLSGASQLRSTILGTVAGLAAVGYVRASEILMGPFTTIMTGISQVAVPEASRVLQRDPGRLARFCFLLGVVQASAALAWGIALMTIFPLGLGPALLDELWGPTAELIVPVTLNFAVVSFITSANAGMRAMGVARRSLRAQLITWSLYVVGGSVGAVAGGALGSTWGVVIALCFGALVCWQQLRSALEEHSPLVGVQ